MLLACCMCHAKTTTVEELTTCLCSCSGVGTDRLHKSFLDSSGQMPEISCIYEVDVRYLVSTYMYVQCTWYMSAEF